MPGHEGDQILLFESFSPIESNVLKSSVIFLICFELLSVYTYWAGKHKTVQVCPNKRFLYVGHVFFWIF